MAGERDHGRPANRRLADRAPEHVLIRGAVRVTRQLPRPQRLFERRRGGVLLGKRRRYVLIRRPGDPDRRVERVHAVLTARRVRRGAQVKRGRAVGVWAAGASLALTAGPLIGGGLVVTVTGWSLLNRDATRTRADGDDDENILEHAFYPFTLPITVGPGSISVAITLGAHLMSDRGGMAFLSPRVLIPGIAGVLIVCASIYICYRYARRAERLLGKTGTIVVMRLSSFILVCIGIQIISTGIRSYLGTIVRP